MLPWLHLLRYTINMIRNFVIIATFVILALGFAMHMSVANDAQEAKKETRPYIVTTTAQVADIVKNIANDDVRLVNLMGSGVDPHLYRPTRSDIIKLRNADAVFYNGLHLEGQMTDILDQLAAEKAVIAIGKALPEDHLLDGFPATTSQANEQTTTYDPHIWMNVRSWIEASDAVLATLTQLTPEKQDVMTVRAAAYKKELQRLDNEIKQVIRSIPENARVLVTAHDAFGYLGEAYGLEVIGIQGLSTESEAGLKHMEQLASLLAERKIPAVFSETSVNPANIRALIENARAKGHNVELGGKLFSDAMGTSDTYEGTYIGMMEHNVRALSNALGGVKNAFLDNKRFAQANDNTVIDARSAIR